LLRGNGNGNASVDSATVPSVGVTHLLGVVMQGTNVTHRLDGRGNGTGILSTAMSDNGYPLFLGARQNGANALSGDLYELIVIGSGLSASDQTSLENYFASSYNLVFVNPNPTNILASMSANLLTLSWPADHTGWTLQAQTNSLSKGLGTNWVNVGNSATTNQVIIPINSTNGSVFYRLFYSPTN
jgi:hypothetical protein